MKIFHSDKAPAAVGPYTKAVRSGHLLFCSGQTPIAPVGGKIESSGVGNQTQRVLMNLSLVLDEAGLTLSDVVRTNVYLRDMGDFAEMNLSYAKCFGAHRPVRTTVAVKGLPYDALVEIDCVAEFRNNNED